jgi:hypothetical protein
MSNPLIELKMTRELDNMQNSYRALFNWFTMQNSAVTTNMLAIVAEATPPLLALGTAWSGLLMLRLAERAGCLARAKNERR